MTKDIALVRPRPRTGVARSPPPALSPRSGLQFALATATRSATAVDAIGDVSGGVRLHS